MQVKYDWNRLLKTNIIIVCGRYKKVYLLTKRVLGLYFACMSNFDNVFVHSHVVSVFGVSYMCGACVCVRAYIMCVSVYARVCVHVCVCAHARTCVSHALFTQRHTYARARAHTLMLYIYKGLSIQNTNASTLTACNTHNSV